MGKAGQVLKQVLTSHDVSQYALAARLGIERTTVYRWCNNVRDPSGDTIVEIVTALKELSPEAARDFVQHYLGELVE
jgi:transcriptional regulator with XRE-family HTH domain